MFPLLASLAISPLVLLRKILLKDRTCGQEFLLKIAEDIGSDRPQSLVTVENILWSKLFDIALGRKTTQEALVEFFEQVSKSHLGPVTKYKKMFFSWGFVSDRLSIEAQAGCLEDRGNKGTPKSKSTIPDKPNGFLIAK
ncbi:hypothetical protein F5890DRAFT_1479209 [Lentinula detonsa]|uniref:ARM repeat-containing protein n=1 Tax=Lentinula detonsa TaxID=2804962 RepID=A0AA38PN41_9AGAR|nr:hypothetical protein F5890DRAFT_1479209 [Lentinula detonsa]